MIADAALPSPAALDWTSRLIAHDTTSFRGNLTLIEEAQAHLAALGFDCALTHDRGRTKANLFATLPGSEGATDGGLVLSGHTDVVPVTGQCWTSDPFVVDVRDGRLFGRGACDMKGFIGTALSLAGEFAAMRPSRPLHYALSFDEEVGCLGAPLMIADFAGRGIAPAGCIVGEPTDMLPVIAHKGRRSYSCRVTGRASHSSQIQDGVNAIEHAAQIVAFIADLARAQCRSERPDPAFVPPHTTICVSRIDGGIAENIVPAACAFLFDVRALPTTDIAAIEATIRAFIDDQVVPAMRAEHPDAGVTMDLLSDVPGLAARGAALHECLSEVLAADGGGSVSYGTEAGQFQQAGMETIVCGPGSIAQAHKADEYVSLAQLARCEGTLRRLVPELDARRHSKEAVR
jgi:acetylornithine deacetylase